MSAFSLSAASVDSSADVSWVDVDVLGLSSGFSEGSVTVAPRLVLQPMVCCVAATGGKTQH